MPEMNTKGVDVGHDIVDNCAGWLGMIDALVKFTALAETNPFDSIPN